MSNYRQTVRIPVTPHRGLSPNARVHWRTRHRLTQEFCSYARLATCHAINTGEADFSTLNQRIGKIYIDVLVQWPKRHKRMDDDNAKASLKAMLDGLALAIGIDDKAFILGSVEQTTGNPPPGSVEFTLSWEA